MRSEMQPVPVHRSRMRRGVLGARGLGKGSERTRCARCVVHASVSGLPVCVSGHGFQEGRSHYTYRGIKTPGLHTISKSPNG